MHSVSTYYLPHEIQRRRRRRKLYIHTKYIGFSLNRCFFLLNFKVNQVYTQCKETSNKTKTTKDLSGVWRMGMAFPYPTSYVTSLHVIKARDCREHNLLACRTFVCDSFSCSFTVKVVEVWATYFWVKSLALALSLPLSFCVCETANPQHITNVTLCRMSSEIERSLYSNVHTLCTESNHMTEAENNACTHREHWVFFFLAQIFLFNCRLV